MTDTALQQAYDYCQQLAKSHYENFPVASLLLPKRLRLPISVIYAFARTADDFADEGHAAASERLDKLNQYHFALKQIEQSKYQQDNPILIALEDVINNYQLPLSLFEDLLKAFKQDVSKSRYANLNEVIDYCRYSANPVGRLLLHLDGEPDTLQLQQSDAICSALQLINFYQDIEQDLSEQNRVYIPQDMLKKAGLTDQDLMTKNSSQLAPTLRNLYQHAAQLMLTGYPLGNSLEGRLGVEVRAMTLGGITTLVHLTQQQDSQLLTRPRLTKTALAFIMFNSLSKNRYSKRCQQLLQPLI